MRLFAISDLHMPGGQDKPMDVFGGNWTDHLAKVEADWRARVGEEDVVLLAGDHSWAMSLDEALPDLGWIGALPGRKVMIRGNHDYWWKSISRVRAALPASAAALQNDAVRIGNTVFAGSRGWTVPGSAEFTDEDAKIYAREVERMRLALTCADKLRGEHDALIVLVHYPPFNVRRDPSELTALFEAHRATAVVYGHLHGKDSRADLELERGGIRYYLTSCDLLGHRLAEIALGEQS